MYYLILIISIIILYIFVYVISSRSDGSASFITFVWIVVFMTGWIQDYITKFVLEQDFQIGSSLISILVINIPLLIVLIIHLSELVYYYLIRNQIKSNVLIYLRETGANERTLQILSRSDLFLRKSGNRWNGSMRVNASDKAMIDSLNIGYKFTTAIQKTLGNDYTVVNLLYSVRNKEKNKKFELNDSSNHNMNYTLKLGVQTYGMTILAALAFNYYNINFSYLILVFTISILMVILFGALSLRASDKLSEKSFMELMLTILKRIPGFKQLL